jgi:hypothetical protein
VGQAGRRRRAQEQRRRADIRLAAPARARHLKLVVLSECSGQPFASVGELDVQVAK